MSHLPASNALDSVKYAEALLNVKSKSQVFSCLQVHMLELRHLGVNECGFFGSFVRDTDIREDSNVDILVISDLAPFSLGVA